MFLALFLVGLLGFVLMTTMGFLHTGGHVLGQGGHDHTPVGHGFFSHGAAAHGSGGHAALPHSGAAHSGTGHLAKGAPSVNKGSTKGVEFKADRTASFFMLLSPVTLFSLMMGAGATGLMLQTSLGGTALFVAAGIGALVFCFGVVRPLMNALSNFASRPSEGLEGMVAQSATAMTRFDKDGRGLISLTLDGQTVQVLALLEADEIERGVQVAKGDSVTIVEVDTVRNRCHVTRELAA